MHPAISELYRVFRPYRLGDDFRGCDCCVSAAETERLILIPLHQLQVQDVDRYAFKAMTTWGEVRHFKHFLPRLLELAFEQYLEFTPPGCLFGKLAYANWSTWPSVEQVAVRGYLAAFWVHQLHIREFTYDQRILDVLAGLVSVGESLGPYLATWSAQQAEAAALHLAQLITESAREIAQAGYFSLSDDAETQSAELVAWLVTDRPLNLLRSFQHVVEPDFPWVLSQLEAIRASVPKADGTTAD